MSAVQEIKKSLDENAGNKIVVDLNIENTMTSLSKLQDKYVFDTLGKLNEVVSDLHPDNNKTLLEGNGSFIGKLFGLNKPNLTGYMDKYKTSKSVIDGIITKLNQSKVAINNDNKSMLLTMEKYKSGLTNLELLLETYEENKNTMDRVLENFTGDKESLEYKELVDTTFHCNQSILDTQEKISVTKQSIMSMDVIIKNNIELSRNIERATTVTVGALAMAVSITQALIDQKNILNTVDNINRATSDLLLYSSEKLHTQGAEIQKMSSTTMLDMKNLQTSIENCIQAYKDIDTFKENSLTNMNNVIDDLRNLLKTTDKFVTKSDKPSRLVDNEES